MIVNYEITIGRIAVIVAENLVKSYYQTRALDGVSFEIKSGEIVGLLGLNGAGKSTILKILGTFLLPSAGRAEIAGFNVEERPDKIRELIGYLPDTPPVYEEMSVEAYLRFVAKLKKVAGRQVEARVHYVLERTRMLEVRHEKIAVLSHGYRQRVGIAQALVNDPKVLILDEPISGLDPIQIVEVRDLINSLRGAHTVILSSHILSEITKTCDRIMMIDRGKLVVQGAEKQIEQELARGGSLLCRITKAGADLETKLRSIAGVQGVALVENFGSETSQAGENKESREQIFEITAEADVRALVAKTIINSGADLLGLERKAAGLEKLFLQLVQQK